MLIGEELVVGESDGDRVEFEQRLGYHVDYYPVSNLMEYWKQVSDEEADALVEEYKKAYTIKIDESGEEVYWEKVKHAAKAEEKTIAFGIGIGAGYLFKTTFQREATSDLTGERGSLMVMVLRLCVTLKLECQK